MTHPSAVPPAGFPYQQQHYVPQPAVPGGHALARPGERLAAKLIDGALITAPLMVLLTVLVIAAVAIANDGYASSDPAQTWVVTLVAVFAAALIVGLIASALSYLYLVTYQVRTGSTVGKRTMKIRTLRMDGAPLDHTAARRRWLASEGIALLGLIPFVGSITGVYAWVDALWLLWDKPWQQCLHDKYARTIVVSSRGGAA